MAITMDDLNRSWVSAVTEFVEDSPWLGRRHIPQLKALMAIAQELDSGKQQAALISQFTLTQRTLLGKAPETAGGDMPPTLPGLDGDWDGASVGDYDA